MKVLVIGSGGREHALVWKIRQSPRVDKLYCAPGNAGIGEMADLVPVGPEEIEGLADFAERERIDLTVVGPELPLTLGIGDLFEERGLKIFGPNREAAKLEGSKVFAKEVLKENHIPTASFDTFSDATSAKRYLTEMKPPYVVKADGLAGGKGVLICSSREEAGAAIDDMLARKLFGRAGENVVIEEFIEGEEASFMALTDGEHLLSLASSQDHKRVFDGDRGPNTGGMGAYSPAPVVNAEVYRCILDEILKPLLDGLKKKGILYRGLLYVGLMITDQGPKVLEFNARFGDPECQPVMMRLKSDLVSLLEATIEGRLDQVEAEWLQDAAVCIVLCAEGYPGSYEKGKEIRGLEKLKRWQRGFVFHAGTARKDGHWFTSGGRVLGVTAFGKSIEEAVREVYQGVSEISWEGMHYRKDIAQRALKEDEGGRKF
ncbi:MAG: phosphoribosylamine--glycine ligase [Deltaproteobacteria bacterium]|nr:phosphoribosylamine--glycine ligase [Deltaproteobacteria bacterium]